MRRRSVLADQVIAARQRPLLELVPMPVRRRRRDWRSASVMAVSLALVALGFVAGFVTGGAW